MGVEAYRIAVRLEDNVSKNDIKNKLIQWKYSWEKIMCMVVYLLFRRN